MPPKTQIVFINKPIPIQKINHLLGVFFDNFVKVVVDIRHGFMAVNAELHADEEQFLLDHGRARGSMGHQSLSRKLLNTGLDRIG